jgi:hypothetical protein
MKTPQKPLQLTQFHPIRIHSCIVYSTKRLYQ